MAERQAKQEAKEKQMLREQNIAAKGGSSTLKKPIRPGSQTLGGQPNRPGTAQVPRRKSSAVPGAVKTQAYSDYEKFKNEYELDVVFTINKDLEESAQQEKLAEMNYN